jgi:hypothetical protein
MVSKIGTVNQNLWEIRNSRNYGKTFSKPDTKFHMVGEAFQLLSRIGIRNIHKLFRNASPKFYNPER